MQLPTGLTLDKLISSFCEEREEAIASRQELEHIWRKARAQYKGKKEGSTSSSYEKGETLNSALVANTERKPKSKRSTVVPNITRPYTNAGTARVADLLLPTGKMPFSLRQTPVSDLQTVYGYLSDYPTVLQQLATALPDIFSKIQDAESAKMAAENAELIIRDWLKESDWSAAVRAQIVEAGIVGTGVIKGPFSRERKVSEDTKQILNTLYSIDDPILAELLVQELKTLLYYTPQIECIKVENCYPDPRCGSDIQNGRYFYEEIPEVSKRQLMEYLEDSSYDSGAIKAALEEGPCDKNFKPQKDSKKPYSIWVRTGIVEWKGELGEKSLGFSIILLLNNRIIKVSPYPLETERFPYNILCWESRDNSWAGIGIPEQMETPQRGLIASVRALMDNMGYSVGPQVLQLDGLIEPIDGDDAELYPYKHWKVKSGLPGIDAMAEAKNAMAFLEFPNYLDKIMPVIQFWLKMTEDITGLSLLLQGQAVTDAVGVSQQLMNNSTTNLRLIVKEWDDKVCKPMITSYYDWVQTYGPESAKGDAVVEPLGSTVLIVRELQQQALLQISQQVLQPIYGISPQKWMKIYLEGFQIDIETLALTDEERQQLQAAEQQPDPKVIVAQIEAQAEVYKADLKKEVDTLKIALEAQFKKLSLQAAQEQAQLSSDTKIAQTAISKDESGKMLAKESIPDTTMTEDAPQKQNVQDALAVLGLQ